MAKKPKTTPVGAPKSFEWKCPKCSADANQHGRGGYETCADRVTSSKDGCMGFICECEPTIDGDAPMDHISAPDHGTTVTNPCDYAHCYHCGFENQFPSPPKNLPKWAKQALEAGWTPPDSFWSVGG